jgi:hypothetical protein
MTALKRSLEGKVSEDQTVYVDAKAACSNFREKIVVKTHA